jgi:hypothetical protein
MLAHLNEPHKTAYESWTVSFTDTLGKRYRAGSGYGCHPYYESYYGFDNIETHCKELNYREPGWDINPHVVSSCQVSGAGMSASAIARVARRVVQPAQ